MEKCRCVKWVNDRRERMTEEVWKIWGKNWKIWKKIKDENIIVYINIKIKVGSWKNLKEKRKDIK